MTKYSFSFNSNIYAAMLHYSLNNGLADHYFENMCSFALKMDTGLQLQTEKDNALLITKNAIKCVDLFLFL